MVELGEWLLDAPLSRCATAPHGAGVCGERH